MLENKEQDLPLKIAPFNIHGLLHALGQSPISTMHKDGPSFPRRGTMGIGGNVTMKDGSVVKIEIDTVIANPGEDVWVYTQGIISE